MTKEDVAKKYLLHLENGEIDKVVGLFTENGIVISPLYGVMPAKQFYETLAVDTNSSKLTYDGLFFEKDTNRMSLLFDYQWELATGESVEFKVVDVIELDSENKIEKLTIIYDTVEARTSLNALKGD